MIVLINSSSCLSRQSQNFQRDFERILPATNFASSPDNCPKKEIYPKHSVVLNLEKKIPKWMTFRMTERKTRLIHRLLKHLFRLNLVSFTRFFFSRHEAGQAQDRRSAVKGLPLCLDFHGQHLIIPL